MATYHRSARGRVPGRRGSTGGRHRGCSLREDSQRSTVVVVSLEVPRVFIYQVSAVDLGDRFPCELRRALKRPFRHSGPGVVMPAVLAGRPFGKFAPAYLRVLRTSLPAEKGGQQGGRSITQTSSKRSQHSVHLLFFLLLVLFLLLPLPPSILCSLLQPSVSHRFPSLIMVVSPAGQGELHPRAK